MAIAPENTNFVTGDILSASQYNETHNTAVKLALEDNSRVVLPTSNAPTNISNGHWVLGAIAGDYINFNGVGSINTPSVFLYDLNALEWLVYPLVNTAVNTDMSLTVWDQYTYYVAEKDFVYYVNNSSTTDSFKVPFIYKCSAATTPLQSPESHPLKWSRTGVYINENTILTLSDSVATLSDNVSSLTTTVNGHTTAIANLVQSDAAINLRIDSVENLISTLGIAQLTQTLENLQTNVSTLSGRVSETESDIIILETNFTGLQTTLIGAITALTGRVGIVESNVTTLQGDFTTLNQNMTIISQEFDVVKAAVNDFPTQVSALNTRVTEVELMVDALDLEATNARITAMETLYPTQIAGLDTRLDELEIQVDSIDLMPLTNRVSAIEDTYPVQINNLGLRVISVEELVSALDITGLTNRVTTLETDIPLQFQSLNTELDLTQVDLLNLSGFADTLNTTLGNTNTLVNNTISRVTTAETEIDELQAMIMGKAEIDHVHTLLYEPKNDNIQAHIATSNIHFTQSNILITKSQISDLGPTIDVETDPIFTASSAYNILPSHITTLNNTSGTNTGDQDLTNLAPLVHTHVEADITNLDKYTKAEITAYLAAKANSIHFHTEADITDLDKYTKAQVDALIVGAGGNLTEAPIDGKQYARQDGVWSEVIGGSSEIVTVDTVTVYDPTKPNDELGYAYYAGNTFVSYMNTESLDPQFQTESLYRCISDALIAESPETNPEKWVYQGTEVLLSNDNTGITVIRTEDDLKSITGYKQGDSVILLTTGAVYFYESGSSSGIVPNDNLTGYGCWVYTPTDNKIEVSKPLLNTSGNACTIIVGREIVHSLPQGTTTLNVTSSFGAGYTKVEKTLVLIDNSNNTSDVAITWPNNINEYWTDNKPAYINANTIIKLEVVIYGSTIAVFNPYFIQNTSASNWSTVYVDSSLTTTFTAVPFTTYLIDATVSPVTAYLPDSTSGNVDEFKFLLNKDTHKLTITTASGIQLIGGYVSQIIPTLKGSLELKSTGTGYDITDDNRSTINVVDITTNRDFGDDNFENNFLYLVKPNGGSLSLTVPTATNITGGIAIRSRFQLEGEGDFTIAAATGLIGDAQSQTVNVNGSGFDIVWYESAYYIQNDTRPKTTSATVTTYPMNEDTTIVDTVTGVFFKQRCATTECPGYDSVTATSINTTITAAAGGAYQCTGSSMVAGSMIGSIPVGNIEVYYNSYKTGAVNIEVYVEYHKRTIAGVETLLGTSAVGTVSSATLTQLRLVAQHIAFDIIDTDYLVVRTYARKATSGSDPVLTTTVEGSNATRSTMEIGASSIAHNTLAGRGGANAHPATAIQLTSGESVESYLTNNNSTPDIIASTTWDGTLYSIDLSAGDITWKAVNATVTSLTIGITFDTDASTKSRVATLVIDNSANTVAITSITFNGTWYWPLGVQPLGLAAGAIAILQVRNIAGTIVLPTYFIKA